MAGIRCDTTLKFGTTELQFDHTNLRLRNNTADLSRAKLGPCCLSYITTMVSSHHKWAGRAVRSRPRPRPSAHRAKLRTTTPYHVPEPIPMRTWTRYCYDAGCWYAARAPLLAVYQLLSFVISPVHRCPTLVRSVGFFWIYSQQTFSNSTFLPDFSCMTNYLLLARQKCQA